MPSSYKNRATPGVYLTEIPAFPPSIVGVETAVPIFIGYTEYAVDPASNKQMYMQAVEVDSMADYYSYFGHDYAVKYAVSAGTETDFDFQAADDTGKAGYYKITNAEAGTRFNMVTAMKLFYANGGGKCFVVSVANYGGAKATGKFTGAGVPIKVDDLIAGLDVAHDVRGPTMIVVPDACLLAETDYAKVTVAEINQAAELKDRMALLDMQGILDPDTWNKQKLKDLRSKFYTDISPAAASFSYGAAYGPALVTSAISESDIEYTNLQGGTDGGALLKNLLLAQCNALYPAKSTKNTLVSGELNSAFAGGEKPATPPKTEDPKADAGGATPAANDVPDRGASLDEYLCNALPLMKQVQNILASKLSVAPPCGILAGIWTANDSNRGVWNAPANISAASVIAPTVVLTDEDQGDYNVPLNGKAINILRAFATRGTVVWGARTLDGNSNDYRYIQVRRTLIYVEQSIKMALQPFVFAPNVGTTWVAVTSMISNFLTGLWEQGGLMGDKASEAFSVQCGLGSTMTGQDILNGYMIVSVTLQMVHPAEFIELTFTQKMQGV